MNTQSDRQVSVTVVFDELRSLDLLKKEPIYDCSGGSYMLLCRDAMQADFDALCSELCTMGCSLYDRHDICGAIHATYEHNESTVHICYVPCESSLRVIEDNFRPSYALAPQCDGGKARLWQFEVDHSLIDCGMCYITECADGSFFIVDSAHSYSVNDNDRIHDFMRERTPQGQRIKVAGWFVSHGHADHVAKLTDYLRYNRNDTDVEGIYFNFPSVFHADNGNWDVADKNYQLTFEKLVKDLDIPVHVVHTGQRFYVRNLCLEVLCTHEDVYPGSLANYNDSSSVIMMSVNGSKVLFPGDAGGGVSDILTSRYGNYLKCDILQAAHHGHFGTSVYFYELAASPVILFPTTQIKYDEELEHYEANRTAVRIADECYIASNGTVGFDLPYAMGTATVLPDETFEDFDGIFNLWGYEYSDERKRELHNAFLVRNGKTK